MGNPTIYASVPRAWLRKFRRNLSEIELSVSGLAATVPLKVSDEPRETRLGNDSTDKRPFYESNAKIMAGYYAGYGRSGEFARDLLYTEVIPIRPQGFLATKGAIGAEDISATVDPAHYHVPPRLKRHAAAAIDLFKRSGKLKLLEAPDTWENDHCLRIGSFDATGHIHAYHARYFDQVGTNLTLDWASGELGAGRFTIRSTVERPVEGRLPALSESHLANTLGVATMIYDRDLQPILRIRADNLASINKRGLHCTVSGAFAIDPNLSPGTYGMSLFEDGMADEILKEAGLQPSDYDLYPIAFARELPRGGKPQLFFAAILKIDEAAARLAAAGAEHKGEFVGDRVLSDAIPEDYSQFRDDKFTYEGWAALHFAEAFIEANRLQLEKSLAA